MTTGRLPVFDVRRQRGRDDRLWNREVQRARFLNVKHLHCPCTVCMGQRRFLLKTVREHLIKNGRDPRMRVWKGPGTRDSSDEEWEEEVLNPPTRDPVLIDAQVDTVDMVRDAFQVHDNSGTAEERVREEALRAFTAADIVHEECSGSLSSSDNEAPDVGSSEQQWDVDSTDGAEASDFDPRALEEAITPLYDAARCTKLAATILLMNLCTVHGVSNSFADEMFTILHAHVLPQDNCLPRNHHAAKSLTKKLGLVYNTIHACEKGCVLFRGAFADAEKCPKCDQPRYKDIDRKKFPVKVLRHFPVIPRLQ
jgi:hypothetical protein